MRVSRVLRGGLGGCWPRDREGKCGGQGRSEQRHAHLHPPEVRRGLAWIDGGDVPLGEASERYRINIAGSAGSIELWAQTSGLVVGAPTLVSVGLGPTTIQVEQVGDFAVSPAEQLDIIIT